MAALHTDEALFLRQFMLGGLEREHVTTRRVIEAIPIDKGDYRPDTIVKSAIDLAWHLVGAELPADALTRIVDFRGILRFPAVIYLQTAQIHSIHHRGQLSMYLRPTGAKVPAICGESFDSAQAKPQSAVR